MFEENALHFAMLTETWLSKKHCPPRVLSDLTIGANLNFIRRDRGSRGGGVAVCYDQTKIRLNRLDMSVECRNCEIVCAIGNSTLTQRKVGVMSVYIPPNLVARDTKTVVKKVVEITEKLKMKYVDPIIFVGGDFNNKCMKLLTDTFPEIKPIRAGATRGGEALDEVYCNIESRIVQKEILMPLSKPNGVLSDHKIIAASANLPRQKRAIKNTFSFRPLTKKGTEKFKNLLLESDWSTIKCSSSSESAVALTELLQTYINECFPLKTRKVKSTDVPWFNEKTRRCVAKKNRIYKKEGKSERYIQARKEADRALKESKKDFFDKVLEKCTKAKNTKGYYQAVKMLQTKEAPSIWNIMSLMVGKTEEEAADAVAEFFNAISQEYPPLNNPAIEWDQSAPRYIEEYEVAARLKSFKKPKSVVYGDINPALVTQFADLLAEPLCHIFNQTLHTLHWPAIWKSETVTVIPKNTAPSSLAEVRNLSCTPLYSKVLESFVLQRLKDEVKLSDRQYGGIKGSSTDHFLLDTWNNILTTIEKPNTAANLISVDFSKAFNRMHHYRCLEALERLGAENITIKWVSSFLYRRTMAVKIGDVLSRPRTVPGGSPQGSILGNFLFCATTDCFTELDDNRSNVSDDGVTLPNPEEPRSSPPAPPPYVASTPTTRGQFAQFRPPACFNDLDGSFQSDDESFHFFRFGRINPLDSTDEEEDEEDISITGVENGIVESYVYIDDFNSIEPISLANAPSHITTHKCRIKVRAARSERLFGKINALATEIGMQVNSKKTQMLCVHPCIHNHVETYIRAGEDKIESTESLKILGFSFNNKPNANYHVRGLIERFYDRLWTLRFLKRAGLSNDKLLEVYYTVIRPAIEYSSIVYHTLISNELSEKLESIQRQAMRIIYGYEGNIRNRMEENSISLLGDRREEAMLRFALKNERNSKYGGRWFEETRKTGRSVRPTTMSKYVEKTHRTDRLKNNPINYMTKLLNEHYRNE